MPIDNVLSAEQKKIPQNTIMPEAQTTPIEKAPPAPSSPYSIQPRAQYYHQFLLQNKSLELCSECVNENEEALRTIYDIDKVAFAETDPYGSYEHMLSRITYGKISSYIVKNTSNQIVGYYQLEPIRNKNLYIYSMGLKPEYRHTKQGYLAIQKAWNDILEYADKNNVESLSLHVESGNKSLVNLYKSLGFKIAQTLPYFYANGSEAYYMQMKINKNTKEASNTDGTKNITPIVLSPKEIAINSYINACKQAEEKLKADGCKSKSEVDGILKECSYYDRDGYPVLSNELLDIYNKLKQNDEYLDRHTLKIMHLLKEENDSGEVIIRKDILPHINILKEKGVTATHIASVLERCRHDNKLDISALNTCLKFLPIESIPHSKYAQAIKNCFDKNGFNQELADYLIAQFEIMDINEAPAFKEITVKDKDGRTVIDYDLTRKIIDEINKKPNTRPRIYSIRDLSLLSLRCDINDYLNRYSFIEKLAQPHFLKNTEIAGLVTAGTTYKNDKKLDIFDITVVPKFTNFKEKNKLTSFDTHSYSEAFLMLLNACKITNIMGITRCDDKLFDKAQHLIEQGWPLLPEFNEHDYSTVTHLINACKYRSVNYLGEKNVCFDEQMLDKILNTEKSLQRRAVHLASICKETDKDGSEHFNNEVFDLLLNAPITDLNSIQHFKNNINGQEKFDMELFKEYLKFASVCDVSNISEKVGRLSYKPNKEALNILQDLQNTEIPYNVKSQTLNGYTYKFAYYDDYSSPQLALLRICFDGITGDNTKFNPNIYPKIKHLLDKGHDGYAIYYLIKSCKHTIDGKIQFDENRYQTALWAMNNGIDILASADLVSALDNYQQKDKWVELYNMGVRGFGSIPSIIQTCHNEKQKAVGILPPKKEFNEHQYEKMKELLSKNLSVTEMQICNENDVFNENIYNFVLELQEKGYDKIDKLIENCKIESKYDKSKTFSKDIYDKIFELEKLGIPKENIGDILTACKINGQLSLPVYNKVQELYFKSYDPSGIIEFLPKCVKDSKFDENIYNSMLKLCEPHLKLKNQINSSDGEVVEKLYKNSTSIFITKSQFGKDVLKYAENMKLSGYIEYAQAGRNIIDKLEKDDVEYLKSKLAELPSPELKLKKIVLIGQLCKSLSRNKILPLIDLIKSPRMTDEQLALATKIFSNGEPYEKQIEEFMFALDVPPNAQHSVKKYLQSAKINEKIVYPNTIEEQLEQIANLAQKTLLNPKIPLESKIKYIDEYKAKKANMEANPEKYTTPKINPKTASSLGELIQAYINIPNNETAFNNTINERMYEKFNIAPTNELLQSIKYDSKYFSKLLSGSDNFTKNFKKLIELAKLNPQVPLEKIRITLPEENSPLWNEYQKFGLTDFIKANLDTKRQFELHNLDFDKWNSFDESLKGEKFSVQTDPEREYKNLKYNIYQVFNDDLYQKIALNETASLENKLKAQGFYFKDDQIIASNNDIGKFLKIVISHFETSNYFKALSGNSNIQLSQDEIDGASGFMDHINGLKKKYDNIQISKNVSDIYFRLSDDNDIGRNIFFGNQVGCCNSVESSYAGYSAPLHLLNAYTRGIEVVDEFGNSYGNSLCFFALVDGKLSFVIDSFEANGKLCANPVLTEELLKFAKKVCEYVGCPNAEIVVGPNYNNFDMSTFKKVEDKTIEILGTVCEPTYCDIVGGKYVQEQINQPVKNRTVFVRK